MANQSNLHPTTSEGKGSPSAYRMDVNIFTPDGKERNITQLIQKVVVTESVFQQSLIAEFSIVDGINMMEDLNITGNEKLSMVIRKQPYGGAPAVDQQSDWYIIDVPLFARPKPDIQAYTLRCVTSFGFVSKMRRVEHVFKGTPKDILSRLYEEVGIPSQTSEDVNSQFIDPNQNEIKYIIADGNTAGIMTYIPPKPTYSEAIQQILSKTSNEKGSPFFSYEMFNGCNHILQSYTNMIDSNPISRYKQTYFLQEEAFTEEAFEERRTRILEISSNLGFSPYKGYKNGAYVVRTHTIDWQTKKYLIKDYNSISTSPPKMDKDLLLHPDFSISGVDYTNTPDTYGLYYSLNELAFSDRGELNIHQHMPLIGDIRKSVVANMGQIEHFVKLHGDFRLSPGRIIELEIPKSGAAEIDEREPDELLSGRYLIISSIHEFSNDGYYTKLKVRKDSINRGGLSGRPIQGQQQLGYNNVASSSAPLQEPLSPVGINSAGPDDGLRGPAQPKPIDITVGYNEGEVDPGLARAVSTSVVISGDTNVRSAEEELDAFGGAGAAIETDFQEENLDDEVEKTTADRQDGSNNESGGQTTTTTVNYGPR